LEFLEYVRKNSLHIDDYIEIVISTRKTTKQRRIDEVIEKTGAYNILVVTKLSNL